MPRLVLPVLALVLALGVACGPAAQLSPATTPAEQVRLADQAAPAKPSGNLPTAAIAASRGLVSMPTWNLVNVGPKRGFNVRTRVLVTSADQQRAVADGEADGATTGIKTPASSGLISRRFATGQQWAGQNLVMRQGVELNGWKDREGERIGAAPGTWARTIGPTEGKSPLSPQLNACPMRPETQDSTLET